MGYPRDRQGVEGSPGDPIPGTACAAWGCTVGVASALFLLSATRPGWLQALQGRRERGGMGGEGSRRPGPRSACMHALAWIGGRVFLQVGWKGLGKNHFFLSFFGGVGGGLGHTCPVLRVYLMALTLGSVLAWLGWQGGPYGMLGESNPRLEPVRQDSLHCLGTFFFFFFTVTVRELWLMTSSCLHCSLCDVICVFLFLIVTNEVWEVTRTKMYLGRHFLDSVSEDLTKPLFSILVFK